MAGAQPIVRKELSPETLDRAGFLLDEYRRNKPWLDELKRLKAEIRAHCEPMAGNAPVRLEGAQYYIDLTRKENEKRVTDKAKAFAALKKAMGLERLVQAITVTFKLLDQWVPAAQQTPFIVTEHTGSRDIECVRKQTA